MDIGSSALVIARYREDISWSDGLKRIVIQKDEDMPNIGYEPASFLFFIIRDYMKLEGEYIFVQGNPFDHNNPLKPHGRKPYKCKPDGAPQDPNLDIHAVCKELDLPLLDEYTFEAGGQFKTTASQIRKRPWEWYVKALSLSIEGKNPWVFERLWPLIVKNMV